MFSHRLLWSSCALYARYLFPLLGLLRLLVAVLDIQQKAGELFHTSFSAMLPQQVWKLSGDELVVLSCC